MIRGGPDWDVGRGDNWEEFAGPFLSRGKQSRRSAGTGGIPESGEEGNWLRSTEFRYRREDQPLPKIGHWRDALDELLLGNETKAAP